MFEGIGKYILALFIIYFISYVVKKIEMAKIFKKANVKSSKAYIPFTCTKELINISHSDPKLFKMTLIPFVNIFTFIEIYKDMLKTFGQDPKDAPYYVFFPMVYFAKLGSGNTKVEIHDYDINNEYLENQSMLYEPFVGGDEKPLYEMTDPGYYVPEKPKEKIVYKARRKTTIDDKRNETILDINNTQISSPVQNSVEQKDDPSVNIFELKNETEVEAPVIEKQEPIFKEEPQSVFTDKSLEPDKRQERIVEVEQKEEEIKNPITENITGRPKMCPKCGAKLAPGATACFLCGTKL